MSDYSRREAELKKLTRSNALRVITFLAEVFPDAFFIYKSRRSPLKIGIFNDLAPLVPFVGESDLRAGLKRYTLSYGYLRSCTEGASRIDLNGKEAGTVSAEEAGYARSVSAPRQKLDAKWQAGQSTAKKKPQPKPELLGFAELKASAARRRDERDLVKSVTVS